MNIEVFSRCPFTSAVFTCMEDISCDNSPIAILDIEYGIDMARLTQTITSTHWKFIIILNNRRHAPIMVTKNILLLSKYASIITIKKMMSAMGMINEIKGKTISLSPNEKILFAYWLDGVSIKTIAQRMSITHKTANNMKNNIYRKYGIKDLLTFLLIAKIMRIKNSLDTEHPKIIYMNKVA
ncbi:helix-turn-helix transcriptional regulator [Pectobacterium cacticida]|uniref:helix-turn-helix transcriptional regulator n=1 Tax=Pectobacterium cacticida TaxID=69221 RepID=UPI003987BE7F